MKYGVWRHENSLCNSAEHVFGLARHLKRIGDTSPEIYVEHEFQKCFAMCIPGVKESDIHFFENLDNVKYDTETWGGYDNPMYDDIYMPNPYPFKNSYPSTWEHLVDEPDETLIFPNDSYENKHNLPKDAIVISIREAGTHVKRVEGSYDDMDRFCNPTIFFDIANHYAEKGYTVVRVGDKNQTPMPVHPNIIDFAKVEDRNMLDDLFLISNAKVFLSCDSGIWPMAGGMKSNMVLSNITSGINKPAVVDWLPTDTTICINKEQGVVDNNFDQLKTAVDKFL